MFVAFSLLTAVLFWPWIPELGRILLGPPEDNMQDIWNTWYVTVTADYNSFFRTNLLQYPEGSTLWYQAFPYPQVFLVKFISSLFEQTIDNVLLIHNITILACVPIAALGGYYLVRHFTGNELAALIGGFIFAFNPSHVQQIMHHVHVSYSSFIPFFVLAYLKASSSRSIGWIVAAIVFHALSALSSWYYLIYNGFFIIFHIVYGTVRDRRLAPLSRLVVPAAILAGTALVLSPILIPMVRQALETQRVYLSGSNTFVADVAAYVAFPPTHLLAGLGDVIYRRLTGNDWEATVYLGLVNLLVLAWAYLKAPGRNVALLTYVLCGMVTFCILASGDQLHVAGARTVPMPGLILSHLPFLRNLRTPSRAIIMVYLFLAIGVGYAIALLWSWRHRPGVRGTLAGLTMAILVDFYPAHIAATPFFCDPGTHILRDDPDQSFGVLDLPSNYLSQNYSMMQQVCHGRPIVQGIVARAVAVSLRDRLETKDFERQRRQLIDAKVKYIVIHKPDGDLFEWQDKDGDPDKYLSTYTEVFNSPRSLILKVY